MFDWILITNPKRGKIWNEKLSFKMWTQEIDEMTCSLALNTIGFGLPCSDVVIESAYNELAKEKKHTKIGLRDDWKTFVVHS